jgi:hypothetical protein
MITDTDPNATGALSPPISMAQYSTELFRPLIGQIFRFDDGSAAERGLIELELVEVADPRGRAAPGLRPPFSLFFTLRSSQPAQREELQLLDDRFESCSWFVNRVLPSGRDPRTPHYQAVFG